MRGRITTQDIAEHLHALSLLLAHESEHNSISPEREENPEAILTATSLGCLSTWEELVL